MLDICYRDWAFQIKNEPKGEPPGDGSLLTLTPYHATYYAYELTRRCPPDSDDRVASASVDAQVDLNPQPTCIFSHDLRLLFVQLANALRRWHRAQESDARERLRPECDVPAQRNVLQLSRRARHDEQCQRHRTGADALPDLPRSGVAERPAQREDGRGAHASSSREPGRRLRGMPHVEDRAGDR